MATSARKEPSIALPATHDLAPALSPSSQKSPASEMSPAATTPTTTVSMATPAALTSKNWVVPPRPKPGRKPATDTPPSKRKAQNRAAQRAFRERRAARVGELEEHIKQIEEEDENEQNVLSANIERLERQVEQYRLDLSHWVERCRSLEKELVSEREGRNKDQGDPVSAKAVPVPSQAGTSANPNQAPSASQAGPELPFGCGNCTTETGCQCIDEAFNVLNATANRLDDPSASKRPHSPSHPSNNKRIKAEPAEELEIDFTTAFMKDAAPRPEEVSPTSAVADRCGFCQDGGPCLCEMTAEDARDREAATSLHNAAVQQSSNGTLVAPISQSSQVTPPPSDGDVSTPQIQTTSTVNPCASGPGTCAQCRADPNSTLFCKSLAASRSQPVAAPSECCGNSASGACCQTQNTPRRNTRATAAQSTTDAVPQPATATTPAITLTCADTYINLSRHPAYERASADRATWMPKLLATTSPKKLEGRPPMEIDAANVMSVLSHFSRRYGEK